MRDTTLGSGRMIQVNSLWLSSPYLLFWNMTGDKPRIISLLLVWSKLFSGTILTRLLRAEILMREFGHGLDDRTTWKGEQGTAFFSWECLIQGKLVLETVKKGFMIGEVSLGILGSVP
jgi:hypothetical protein